MCDGSIQAVPYRIVVFPYQRTMAFGVRGELESSMCRRTHLKVRGLSIPKKE